MTIIRHRSVDPGAICGVAGLYPSSRGNNSVNKDSGIPWSTTCSPLPWGACFLALGRAFASLQQFTTVLTARIYEVLWIACCLCCTERIFLIACVGRCHDGSCLDGRSVAAFPPPFKARQRIFYFSKTYRRRAFQAKSGQGIYTTPRRLPR